MQFRDIIGYESLKEELRRISATGHIPHNILFDIEDGMPGVGLALAWIQYLNCSDPHDGDSCGVCPHCKMLSQLSYPDVHYIFPVVNATDVETPSDNFLSQWREMFAAEGAYFDHETWLRYLNAGKQQPVIYSKDAIALENKLSISSSEGGYRMVIIYEPDRMNEAAANKLLKLMEEPPDKTIIVSVCFATEQLLETIVSRMQRFELLPLTQDELKMGLRQFYPQAQERDLLRAALRSDGILLRARQILSNNTAIAKYTECFGQLIGDIVRKDVVALRKLSEKMDSEGREWIVAALVYFEECFRLSFAGNFTGAGTQFSTDREQAIFIALNEAVTPANIESIYHTTESAIRHVRGNVSAKMVLFDTFLRYTAALSPALKAREARSI